MVEGGTSLVAINAIDESFMPPYGITDDAAAPHLCVALQDGTACKCFLKRTSGEGEALTHITSSSCCGAPLADCLVGTTCYGAAAAPPPAAKAAAAAVSRYRRAAVGTASM